MADQVLAIAGLIVGSVVALVFLLSLAKCFSQAKEGQRTRRREGLQTGTRLPTTEYADRDKTEVLRQGPGRYNMELTGARELAMFSKKQWEGAPWFHGADGTFFGNEVVFSGSEIWCVSSNLFLPQQQWLLCEMHIGKFNGKGTIAFGLSTKPLHPGRLPGQLPGSIAFYNDGYVRSGQEYGKRSRANSIIDGEATITYDNNHVVSMLINRINGIVEFFVTNPPTNFRPQATTRAGEVCWSDLKIPGSNASDDEFKTFMRVTPIYVLVSTNCYCHIKVNFGSELYKMELPNADSMAFGSNVDMDVVNRQNAAMKYIEEKKLLAAMTGKKYDPDADSDSDEENADGMASAASQVGKLLKVKKVLTPAERWDGESSGDSESTIEGSLMMSAAEKIAKEAEDEERRRRKLAAGRSPEFLTAEEAAARVQALWRRKTQAKQGTFQKVKGHNPIGEKDPGTFGDLPELPSKNPKKKRKRLRRIVDKACRWITKEQRENMQDEENPIPATPGGGQAEAATYSWLRAQAREPSSETPNVDVVDASMELQLPPHHLLKSFVARPPLPNSQGSVLNTLNPPPPINPPPLLVDRPGSPSKQASQGVSFGSLPAAPGEVEPSPSPPTEPPPKLLGRISDRLPPLPFEGPTARTKFGRPLETTCHFKQCCCLGFHPVEIQGDNEALEPICGSCGHAERYHRRSEGAGRRQAEAPNAFELLSGYSTDWRKTHISTFGPGAHSTVYYNVKTHELRQEGLSTGYQRISGVYAHPSVWDFEATHRLHHPEPGEDDEEGEHKMNLSPRAGKTTRDELSSPREKPRMTTRENSRMTTRENPRMTTKHGPAISPKGRLNRAGTVKLDSPESAGTLGPPRGLRDRKTALGTSGKSVHRSSTAFF